MNIRASVVLMAIVAAITGLPATASGQGYRPPAGPTITPFLDYFNAPISPLMDNYHTYVRPRAELRSNLSRLGTSVNQQNRRLDQLGQDFRQFNPSQAAPTGTGSSFMNYSHYYSGIRQQAHTFDRPAYRSVDSGGSRGASRGY